MNLQNLSLWDVAIAALLIVVNGAVSVALKLDLERKLAWAASQRVAPSASAMSTRSRRAVSSSVIRSMPSDTPVSVLPRIMPRIGIAY